MTKRFTMPPPTDTHVLRLVWTLAEHDRSGPRERIASAFDDVLNAAIKGLVWAKDDWSAIMRRYGGHCRVLFGDYNPLGVTTVENWYCRMIKADNASACKSYEEWAKRSPFRHPESGERMWEGARFSWEGQEVILSSFKPSTDALPHGAIVAVTPPEIKPRRIFRLTRTNDGALIAVKDVK